MSNLNLDPFDTSQIYSPQLHRYYSHVTHDSSLNQLSPNQCNHYTTVPSPIDMTNITSQNTNFINQLPQKESVSIDNTILVSNMNSLSVNEPKLDAKLLEELEKKLGKKENQSEKNLSTKLDNSSSDLASNSVENIVIPTLKPPPNKIKNTNQTLMLPCKLQNSWPSKMVNVEQDISTNDRYSANITSNWSKSTNLEHENATCLSPKATNIEPIYGIKPVNTDQNHFYDITNERIYDNMSKINPTSQDTSTVVTRIWYERNIKDVNAKVKQTNLNGYVDTGWSESLKQPPPNHYGALQNPPILSIKTTEFGEFKCNQRSTPEKYYNSLPRTSNYSNSTNFDPLNDANPIANTQDMITETQLTRLGSPQVVNKSNIDPNYTMGSPLAQGSPLRSSVDMLDSRTGSSAKKSLAAAFNQYGAPVQVLPESYQEGSRIYNEVENVYSEIEHVYSQPPQEVLRPHRPAPPSPLVLGYPQSMQQLQRKLGQTQVIFFKFINKLNF